MTKAVRPKMFFYSYDNGNKYLKDIIAKIVDDKIKAVRFDQRDYRHIWEKKN